MTTYGIHLPQFGRAAVPGAVERAARHAEALGFDDVWVSDHLVVPEGQAYPAPHLVDPLMTLAFAGAATETVGLGTSVLVGPQYTSPLALANSLASLDFLSAGRLIVGIGIGWSQKEYEALLAPFDHRGERLDEMIDLFRTAWRDDPATHKGRWYSFESIHVQPQPAHHVPIWIGGSSEGAFARAFTKADGYHGIAVEPDQAPALVDRIRRSRPEGDFTISLRVPWDARSHEPDDIRAQRDAYEAAGIQHLMAAPTRGSIDAWLEGMETIAHALDLEPR
jgi:probable F420-dependent oxidoreductase